LKQKHILNAPGQVESPPARGARIETVRARLQTQREEIAPRTGGAD